MVGDVARLEELGRKIMAASVEAEYLGLSSAVSYLDGAFADVVRTVAEARGRGAQVQVGRGLESAREGPSGS